MRSKFIRQKSWWTLALEKADDWPASATKTALLVNDIAKPGFQAGLEYYAFALLRNARGNEVYSAKCVAI